MRETGCALKKLARCIFGMNCDMWCLYCLLLGAKSSGIFLTIFIILDCEILTKKILGCKLSFNEKDEFKRQIYKRLPDIDVDKCYFLEYFTPLLMIVMSLLAKFTIPQGYTANSAKY